MRNLKRQLVFFSIIILFACSQNGRYDIIIFNGNIYDGSGKQPYIGSIAINGDSIVAIGDLEDLRGKIEIDAGGMAIAPGFINMLSWATESLIEDGRSMADIKQGVTLEVMGEGVSMGPWNEEIKKEVIDQQGDLKYEIEWNTLGEYLNHLVDRGVSTNVASFVGATTIRQYFIGNEDRPPEEEELDSMCLLVREAMEEGAMGVASALIYAPGFYAGTLELIELCREASKYNGMYISHLRSEGARLLEAYEELLTITKETGISSEIYHLKAAGKSNWSKMDKLISIIESDRAEGFQITADMYTYTAGATGLDASMPPWVQEGGLKEWIKRLKDPGIREKLRIEITSKADGWENLYFAAGTAENILLVGFKNDSLKYLTGKTLAEVAMLRGTSPEETAMDLVIDDESRVGTVYFLMSEENVKKQIALPWLSFCSDAGSGAAEGVFLKSNPHPREYGNFSRLLGKYVREEKVIPLQEAIRKLTSLPAKNLKIKDRGFLKPGFKADIVVFDAENIIDHATFSDPHQYSTGMIHVFVNGIQVLKDGEHTGATPGQVVHGPGWTGWNK